MNNIEKIQQMLNSDDEELQELGVLMFHNCIESKWKGETLNDCVMPSYKAAITRARINVHLKRIKNGDN